MDDVKTNDLLSQLKYLESSLSTFSFESLNSAEAASLKHSFTAFKNRLEDKINNPQKPMDLNTEVQNVSVGKDSVDAISQETKFIAHISHEIRTPLNGIIGFANLLREDDLNESQAKKVDAIQTASQNLLEIINEVLEYSKISSGMEEFMAIDFNFHGLIKDVVFLCQTLLVDRNIDFQLKIDNNIPGTLVGDPSKLSQVLLNILGNAVKFVEKGHIRMEIKKAEKKLEGVPLEFVIEDSGIGMSKEQLRDIFKCFKQGDKETYSKYGGTGLGLCIVKEIIEKQGGWITAESEIGVGSTFKFALTFKKGASKNIPKSSLDTIHTQKGRDLLNGTRILVFEDNLMNQHLIQEQLNKWGCRVFVTSNADKGLGILKTQAIDLILMDLKMPDVNGFQLSTMIRANSQIKQVPIIAVSADFTAQDQENCIASGINDFLLKPYTLDELLKKLIKAKRQASFTEETKALLDTAVISRKKKDTVDMASVLKDCCGEVDVLEELIRLFKQNVYEFIGTTKIGLQQDTLEDVGFAAHKLKAGLRMLKLEGLADMMVAIQTSCERQEAIKIRSMFEDFLKSYPEYEKEIDSAFEEIKKKS